MKRNHCALNLFKILYLKDILNYDKDFWLSFFAELSEWHRSVITYANNRIKCFYKGTRNVQKYYS